MNVWRHQVEIYPLDLNKSQRRERHQESFGFIIKPPLHPIVDAEFLDKAARRVWAIQGKDIKHATFSLTNATATYGTFETHEEGILNQKDQIVQNFKLVLDRALGGTLELNVTFVEKPEL